MIRLATIEDAAACAAIYAPIVEHTATSFEVTPPDAHDFARRIADVLVAYPWLVATDPDGVLGYAYASRHKERHAYQWSVDTSVYVHERGRGRGVGTALYQDLFARLRRQNIYAAHAGITLPNAASVALHESIGFRPVGVYERVGFKHGAWHDVGWWQKELLPRTHAPQAVVGMK